jgi:hypothetical protein
VYRSGEGRKSIDAVVLGACLCAVLLLGTMLFGANDPSDASLGAAAATLFVNGAFSLAAFLKGKLVMGAVGIFAPVVGLVGAIRLARPGSPWARWRYRACPRKMARAVSRCARYDARWKLLRSALGGVPTPG